jgi:hypothetical protein
VEVAVLSMLDVSTMAHCTASALYRELELSSRALVSRRLFTRTRQGSRRQSKVAVLSMLDVSTMAHYTAAAL